MDVVLIKIGDKKPSKHGGSYRRIVFKGTEDKKLYRLDVYEGLKESTRWKIYLKEQHSFSNVSIIRNNLIDPASQFIPLGIIDNNNTKNTINEAEKTI